MKIGIIGGGPGGYSSALRLASAGHAVKIFEKKEVGGVCLNRGCIPTKSLISSASLLNSMKKAKRLGITAENVDYDWNRVQGFKKSAVKRIVLGVQNLLKDRDVKIIGEEAFLSDGKTIKAGDKAYNFDKIIIATGSEPFNPPFDCSPEVWFSNDALNTEEIPESLTIIGGGVIGLEFGYIFSSFGSDVKIVEMMDEILPGEDSETSGNLRKSMQKQGIKFFLSSKVKSITLNENFRVSFEKENKTENLESERVLIATGRVPRTEGIGDLIEKESGRIKVDRFQQTNIENIYAVGDCTGGNLLAHKAYKEAEIASKHISGQKNFKNYSIPRVVYTKPELASTGLSEEDARRSKENVRVTRFEFAGNGRAIASGKIEGGIKIIHTEDGEILGASILGDEASELITELSIAIDKGLKVSEMAEVVFPHPTRSEVIGEVINRATGNQVH